MPNTIIPMTQPGQQVQPAWKPFDPAEALRKEKAMQPNQQPMQAVINGGEEVIPADVVNMLGGSKGLQGILNSVLATRGLKLSGDKGTAKAGPSQGPLPNMCNGTVGKVVNYATGTTGNLQLDQPPPPLGTTPPKVSGMATPGLFDVPTVPQQSTGQNQNVLQAAQNKALQGANTQTLGMTSQLTQNMLQNPQQGFNPQQNTQFQMQKFDYDRAKAMQAAQAELAPVWNTGAGASKYIDLGTKGALDRATLQNQLEEAGRQESLANIYKAIEAGRQTSEQERTGYATDIGALVDVRGAAEGQENRNFQAATQGIDNAMKLAMQYNDIQGQQNLATLNSKLQEGLLMKEQDFQAVQADLDRQQEILLQKNDYIGAEKIEKLKQEFAALESQKTREFSTAERIATQSWQSSERVSAQDFERARMYYESELAEARAKKDFEREKSLLESQQLHELKMQTNDMDYGQKMAYLNYNLEQAKANADVGRQQTLLMFQHGQEMERLASEQGHDAAMQYSKFHFDKALSEQDFLQAEILQRQTLEFQASENAKDRLLENMKIELQQRGMDMAQFNALQAEVEAGRIEPQAAQSYLQQMLYQSGYMTQLNPVDIETQTRNAIKAEYDSMQYQFALTHPNMTPEEAAGAFFDWYNENQYGEGSVPISDMIVDSSMLVGSANPNDANHSDYQALYEKASEWTPKVTSSGGGWFNGQQVTRRFDKTPAAGTPFTIDGTLYVATSGVALKKEGYPNTEYFTAKDVNTGDVKTFYANDFK